MFLVPALFSYGDTKRQISAVCAGKANTGGATVCVWFMPHAKQDGKLFDSNSCASSSINMKNKTLIHSLNLAIVAEQYRTQKSL